MFFNSELQAKSEGMGAQYHPISLRFFPPQPRRQVGKWHTMGFDAVGIFQPWRRPTISCPPEVNVHVNNRHLLTAQPGAGRKGIAFVQNVAREASLFEKLSEGGVARRFPGVDKASRELDGVRGERGTKLANEEELGRRGGVPRGAGRVENAEDRNGVDGATDRPRGALDGLP